MSDDSDIRRSVRFTPPQQQKTISVSYNLKSVIKVLVFILLLLVAFGLGKYYGDHQTKSFVSNGSNTTAPSTNGGGFRRGGGGFGTVSAVTSSSITIDNPRTGTSKTYSITSSTKITSAGQSASISSIAKGDRVIVMPSTNNSSIAATIIVNPSFGGGFGGAAPTQSGGSSTSTGSSTGGSSTTGSSTGSATAQ